MSTENKESAGDLLRQGRLRQRLSIAECAKRTHISSRYIEAIEEEKWAVLPSESHRVGFLRLYSRFLGVSTDEVMSLYHKSSDAAASVEAPKEPPRASLESSSSSPMSWPQMVGWLIATLLLAWGAYHAVRSRWPESHPSQWVHLRSSAPRLITPNKPLTFNEHVRVTAQADSWMRVVQRHQLLYEGILPAGSTKEWTGPGPFQFKIGNVKAVSVYWNDQPVDIASGAQGNLNELQLPLNK